MLSNFFSAVALRIIHKTFLLNYDKKRINKHTPKWTLNYLKMALSRNGNAVEKFFKRVDL